MPIDNIKVFENESARVKGLSFHPIRTWILAALHTGTIQLWDYRLGYIVATFHEHEGPVRCVSFHPTQSLFASGGDDSKIKLWNPHSSIMSQSQASHVRSVCTLSGHMDYIRSVTFHSEYPWVMSASDDQTIRIWNWQSRTCIAVLTGHNHYVMCAAFGPFNSSAADLVASASLDQTIRIWDISGLKRKHSNAPSTSSGPNGVHLSVSQYPGSFTSPRMTSSSPQSQLDLFAATEVITKHILEGHDRGVNWVDFHPSGFYIVSGADDKQVKIWQLDGSRAWETDSLGGHFNNVSCVKFSYNGEIILSNSEDKTIRIWDVHRRTCLYTIRRDHDRFWSIVQKPSKSETLFAASHDSGFVVFKLSRERPAFHVTTIPNEGIPVQLLFCSNRQLKIADLKPLTHDQIQLCTDQKQLSSILSISSLGSLPSRSGVTSLMIGDSPSSIEFHQNDNSAILNYSFSSPPSFEYYSSLGAKQSLTPSITGNARSAFFLTRNRFAILDSEGMNISLYSAKDLSRTISLPFQCLKMYPATMTSILLCSGDTHTKLSLYDIQLGKISSTADLAVPPSTVKSVQWSPDHSLLLVFTKHNIFVYSKKLDSMISTLHSDVPIKSVCWARTGSTDGISTSTDYFLLFSTLFHVKYFIPSCSDSGIMYQTPEPVYLVGLCDGTLYTLDRRAELVVQPVDLSEISFKLALGRKDLDAMIGVISSGALIGQSIISYLHKNGYPQLAMKYVKEPVTRFELALECGDMQVALEMAQNIDKEMYWNRLADESLMAGRLSVTEQALLKTGDYHRLFFIYLITGQREKIQRLERLVTDKGGDSTLLHLLTGDIEGLSQMYLNNGHDMLHYLASNTFNLTCAIEPKTITQPITFNNSLPTPLLSQAMQTEMDWPWTGSIDDLLVEKEEQVADEEKQAQPERMPSPEEELNVAVASWGIEDEWGQVAIEQHVQVTKEKLSPRMNQSILPTSNTKPLDVIYSNSNRPLDHIIHGSFESAFQLLNRLYGVTNFGVIKDLFLRVYQESRLWIPASGLCVGAPCLVDYIHYASDDRGGSIVSKDYVQSRMDQALQLTTQGRFSDAINLFRDIQYSLLLMQDDVKRGGFCKEHIKKTSEYISALLLEITRKSISLPQVSNNGTYSKEEEHALKRAFLLLALFTHCELIPVHRQLALRVALTQTFKYGNWKMAHGFALKLLETNPAEAVQSQTTKLKDACEANMQRLQQSGGELDIVPITEYEPMIPFVICHADYTPIYKKAGVSIENMVVNCSFCQSSYRRDTINGKKEGIECSVCQLTKITGH